MKREIKVRSRHTNTAETLFFEDHPLDYIISFNVIKAQISIIKNSLVSG